MLGAATRRGGARQPSLLLGRFKRGLRRQLPLLLGAAALFTAAGAAYSINAGGDALTSALMWAPFGLVAAAFVALVRELERNTITVPASLGKYRGYGILGAAPDLTPSALRELAPNQRSPLGLLAFRPASPFATAFRDLQDAISSDNLVAFLAPRSGEGASTVSLCAAVSAFQQGRKVIVVDCDIRRRTLSHMLHCNPHEGVFEACHAPEHWQSFVEEEPETGLHFLPAAGSLNPWRTLLGSPGFPMLLDHLRKHYDLVVLDCPPALSSGDGAIMAGLADRVVAVAAWDRTPISALRNAVQAVRRHSETTTGVYVNRVPPGYRFGRRATE